MRVTRRVRPSQVGCAVSIGRRRLYASTLADREPAAQSAFPARLTLIIHPDGQIVAEPELGEREPLSARSAFHEAEAVAGR